MRELEAAVAAGNPKAILAERCISTASRNILVHTLPL